MAWVRRSLILVACFGVSLAAIAINNNDDDDQLIDISNLDDLQRLEISGGIGGNLQVNLPDLPDVQVDLPSVEDKLEGVASLLDNDDDDDDDESALDKAADIVGNIAKSGARLAGGAVKLKSKLVAPLFVIGAKITAPIVKLKSKLAAPIVLVKSALAKPFIKKGVKIAAPTIKLAQA